MGRNCYLGNQQNGSETLIPPFYISQLVLRQYVRQTVTAKAEHPIVRASIQYALNSQQSYEWCGGKLALYGWLVLVVIFCEAKKEQRVFQIILWPSPCTGFFFFFFFLWRGGIWCWLFCFLKPWKQHQKLKLCVGSKNKHVFIIYVVSYNVHKEAIWTHALRPLYAMPQGLYMPCLTCRSNLCSLKVYMSTCYQQLQS